MTLKRMIAASLAVAGVVTVRPTDAAAQGEFCYNFCLETCPVMGEYQGEDPDPLGWVGPFCTTDPSCTDCPFESVAEGASVTEISDLLLTASDLAQVVQTHGERLLLSPERNMVAIKGGCTGDAAVSLVFLEPARIEALAELKVGSLEEHIRATATGT